MDNTDKYIGQYLDNRYEILEKIGTGGMAVVYKALCHRLNRPVAIKILKDELSGDADFRRRFQTESQAVAMLSHPNIVAVYDVSRSGNIEYIVMELIEGITLKQYINRKGLLNWKEALHFATQVTKALGHAHSRGIIHRDIKPHNIMILKDGSVKVADFGIARLQSTQNTLTQEALGSVHYISPEQAKGSHVDARSDIYSLGVVMYEMLTSHLPFEGDSAVSIAIQHISAIPLMPREINPEIPPGLESITMHAMEPDLNARYASAEEVLHDLEEFRKNPAITFTYYMNDNLGRFMNDQATRSVPSGAIVKAESALPKLVRTPGRNLELSRKEYDINRKKSSKNSALIAVVGIIIFLIAAFSILWFGILKDLVNPESMTIPNFVGLKYADIIANQDNINTYNFTVKEEYSADTEAGVVMSQNPQANRQQAKPAGGKIAVALTVSKGKEPDVTMPDLVNMDYRDAKIELQKLGLDLDVQPQSQYDDKVTEGYVISTKPAAGDTLVKGQTVYIIYSDGPDNKMVEVPNVEGLPLAVAESKLSGLGFVPKISDSMNDPNVPKGYVISQDLTPNSMQPYKSVVYLIISDGPVESPAPSQGEASPSSSPSPSP